MSEKLERGEILRVDLDTHETKYLLRGAVQFKVDRSEGTISLVEGIPQEFLKDVDEKAVMDLEVIRDDGRRENYKIHELCIDRLPGGFLSSVLRFKCGIWRDPLA